MALEWLSKHTTHMQRECRNDCLDDTNVLRHKTHPYVNTMHSCSEQMTRECIADSLTYPLFVYKMIRKTEYTSIISTNNKISRVTTLQTIWNSVTFPWRFAAHVKGYSYHAGTSVIVSGGGRNAKVHDLKPKWNAQVHQSPHWTQICS